MKILIELNVEDEREAKMFLAESAKATGINIEVGRALYAGKVHGFGDQDPSPARVFGVTCDEFKASAGSIMERLQGKSFDVTWGPDHGRPAGYYVSIPNYDGGKVVPLAAVAELLGAGELRGQPIFHTDTNLRPEQVLPPGSKGSIRSY